MIMRKRPIRGEKYILPLEAYEVTVLQEKGKNDVEVILPNGKITLISKSLLDLPTIDTHAYDKIRVD